MPVATDTAAAEVDRWLAEFEHALAATDAEALRALFHAGCHWRDVLALSWRITTVSSAQAVVRELTINARRTLPDNFRRDFQRTQPRLVTRAGTDAIEAIFTFDTAEGRCNGVLRLTPEAKPGARPKAWTLLTALDEIKGHAEHAGTRAPTAVARDFSGPNWLDRRKAAQAYAGRDPAVLVVGAGQAGLSIAARLTQLGVDTLIVDRHQRIGDNWRKRYHALTLHNQTRVNHLPYMPFPPGWPAYIPKDKLAGWFEAYAESLELNAWTATEFEGGTYDETEGRWSVVVRRADGTVRRLTPRHVVLATGVSGIPNIPAIPTLDRYKGSVLHSSGFTDGAAWRGKRVLVIGTGTSGHDIAQDLHSNGADVTMVQRHTTMVVNIEPSAQLPYTLYDEGPPLADCDLITTSVPLELLRKSYQLVTGQGRQLDRPLLDRLERRGFKLDFGEDGTGWQLKYLTRGGGYYFNVGCSDLIADGEIGLVQHAGIDGFVAGGARLKTGETVPADLIVLATGYKGQEHLVAKLFGDDVARRIGPVWGFGESQELRNMFTATAQPGLWFIAGSFAQCRIYSKYLALQIQACEAGLRQLRAVPHLFQVSRVAD
jgi:cation diffusion facilitator CzcD-associated flavoprotein CzcO